VLERLRGELDLSLDKLVTRERFLNDQFDGLMSQYRAARGQMQGVQVRDYCPGIHGCVVHKSLLVYSHLGVPHALRSSGIVST